MIDKSVLTQYTSLKKEIVEVEEKIRDLERQIWKIEEEGSVKDKVMGGEGGNHPYTIEGFPYPEYSRKKTLLYSRKTTLEILKDDLLEKTNEVEQFIATVKDSHIRRIIDMRVIKNMSWKTIANKIGGGNTEDSVKKAFYRFIDKN
ncbi:MAG: hypothetical protein Q4A15_05755 [Prevotellaceae bacterium]|nr:hypothetical protein [Prevotellaceae bacterium]